MTEKVRDEAPLRGELRPSGPVRLSLTETRRGDLSILGVTGELDILTAPKVGARLDEIVRSGSGNVVIDLRATSFMDSAGLYILVNAGRRLADQARRFSVVCGDSPVRRVFEVSRVADRLGVVRSFDEL